MQFDGKAGLVNRREDRVLGARDRYGVCKSWGGKNRESPISNGENAK